VPALCFDLPGFLSSAKIACFEIADALIFVVFLLGFLSYGLWHLGRFILSLVRHDPPRLPSTARNATRKPGGYNERPSEDLPLLIAATCLIVGLRTSKWSAARRGTVSNALDREIEYSHLVARRVVSYINTRREPDLPEQEPARQSDNKMSRSKLGEVVNYEQSADKPDQCDHTGGT
jgi:hypothetical protein